VGLYLTSTSDKVQIVTGSAGAVDAHASWASYDPSQPATDRVTLGRNNVKVSTAATTDLIGSPASGVTRNPKVIHIANVHASIANQVTLQHTDGTNVIQIESVNLQPGERIDWREGVPMRVIDANGFEKVNPAVAGSYNVQRLAADVSNSTVTAAKITGLDLACGVGTWIFEYFVLYQSSTAATGIKFGCNHSGTVSSFVYDGMVATADITTNTGLADQDVLLTTGATPSIWAARAKTTSAPMITSGVDTINSDMLLLVQGLAIVTVAGNLEFYHASETAVATTIKAGSVLRLTKMA
jgi:hypothetical protein